MTKKLYVGNLPFSIDDQALTEMFENFGTVESARVVIDRDSNRSKGFGFVEMSDDQAGEKAISELDGSDYQGRPLRVNEAKPQEPRRNGGGGGGRGGRRGGFGY